LLPPGKIRAGLVLKRDGDASPTVTFVSYEFDYYDSCGDHWRDAQYNPNDPSNESGTIGNC